jgi:hypothetical protein
VWVPIVFLSKDLNDMECNYDIHNKEMLGVMHTLYEWQHFLQESQRRFEIWTDHKNLEYFITTKKLNRQQARWSLELSEYNFTLVHKPGKQHTETNVLSRRGGHERGEHNNSNMVLLPETLFANNLVSGAEFLRAMPTVLDDTLGDRFMEEIKQKKNLWEAGMKEALRKDNSGWEEHDGFLTKDGLIYMPPDEVLQHWILKAHHNDYLTGHPGQYRTVEVITCNYYWPTVLKETKKYVVACPTCQRTKIFPTKPREPLHPNGPGSLSRLI